MLRALNSARSVCSLQLYSAKERERAPASCTSSPLVLHLLNALGTLRHVQSALLDQKPLTCTCMHQRGSDGPLLPSLCHRAGIHVTPRGWPATARTLSLCRSNCSNIIFQGVAELPMDQQINLWGFILWPSLKNKQVCKILHSLTSFTP